MNPNWVDFKELRTRLTFPFVMQHYDLKLTEKGEQLVGFCPLPNHGDRHSPSFSAHPQKGIFQCFGCGAKGNVLDFAVLYDGGDPKQGRDVRKTALKFHKLLRNESPTPAPPKERSAPNENRVVVTNEPLNFCLKDLDSEHPYLAGRGFSAAIMRHFGVGFCARGVLAGRIAIPLHSREGQLIGYAGRVIDDTAINENNPKYLFPSKRETDDRVVEFKKSFILYNDHRIYGKGKDLVIVEGFCSVWWLTQAYHSNVVAIMGSSASPEQIELILILTKPQGRVFVFTDNDEAGQRCGFQLVHALSQKRQVFVILGPKRQPTDYTPEELHSILRGADSESEEVNGCD